MKDGDYILTSKPNPWYQMVVERRLDRLIWSQFPYTEENCKEIEECIEKLKTFKLHYQNRIDNAFDKSIVLWCTQRIKTIETSIDYYTRNYEYKIGIQE